MWKKRHTDASTKPAIAPVLRQYGLESNLRGFGRSAVRCPFHADTNPSATVDETEQWFHCHTCGIHDDAIGLVRVRDWDGSKVDRTFQEAKAIVGGGGTTAPRKPLLPRRGALSIW